jgi:hypothetical protein
MPKPSRNQIAAFKQYEKRQQIYEKRYQKQFFKYLRKTYNDAANYIKENGVVGYDFYKISDNEALEKIFFTLFRYVTINEAKIGYEEMVLPYEEDNRLQKKDIIDDIVGLFSGRNTNLIRMWQSLLDNFLEVRLTGRISRINQTTNERIARIIENGLLEGLGQEDIAREIRKEAGSNINVNRSRYIARTETVVAANQGKYLSARSSRLVMKKKWMPAVDARTRHSHRDMLNRDWIGLEEDFAIMNQELGVLEPALYPGDARLSAANVINCRCTLVCEPQRDSNGNLIIKP